MSLKSLVLCADEKIVRVLRRVMGDLDIAVELCVDADSALRRLTRQRGRTGGGGAVAAK